MAKRLPKLLEALAKRYEAEGKKAELTELRDPFTVGAWFILGQHAKRNGQARAYEALRRAKGITPGQLLSITPEKLHTVCQTAGPYEDKRSKDLYAYADRIEEKCGQDFSKIFKSEKDARKFMEEELHQSRDFIDMMLLYGGKFPIFPVDTRIARVASRLGFGKVKNEKAPDEKAVKEIQKALEAETGKVLDDIIRAHGLLFRHGGDVCTPVPACDVCPLLKDCPYGKAHPPAPKETPTQSQENVQQT
jgi:endonuclease III